MSWFLTHLIPTQPRRRSLTLAALKPLRRILVLFRLSEVEALGVVRTTTNITYCVLGCGGALAFLRGRNILFRLQKAIRRATADRRHHQPHRPLLRSRYFRKDPASQQVMSLVRLGGCLEGQPQALCSHNVLPGCVATCKLEGHEGLQRRPERNQRDFCRLANGVCYVFGIDQPEQTVCRHVSP
ncbi:hypothetical protein BDZ88DRAFT_121883 [Geranomyces variabilis]|nr:hypothetical protein BDZ88DRAFT_121883 [Geranomyces variabilis]